MDRFDTVVVGGGPAGLAAALYLGRFRRSVLVIDAGDSRALRIPRSHNMAGFAQGVPGADLLRTMRRQAEAVGARFVDGYVQRIDPAGGDFTMRWPGGQAQGAAVLLATGATDNEPPMAPIAEAVQEGALRYCPVCDGYEVAGSTVGVVCNGPAGLREAEYLRHFTPDLHAFMLQGAPAVEPGEVDRLAREGIVVHPHALARIELADHRAVVEDTTGHRTVCDSVYSALGMKVHSELAVRCGAEADADGYVTTDRHQETTVPGLFCAGDVAKGLNQISVAIGDAAAAASAMHLRLLGRAA